MNSIYNQKKGIFTTIGAYTSMMESKDLKNDGNLFPSINNKKDVVPFLLDLLKVIVGSSALQELTGHLFSDFTDNAEENLKSELKKQTTQYNSGENLPETFKTNGISVPVKNIDTFNKFKTSPDSDVGTLLYDSDTMTFDKKAYEAIQNSGTDIGFGNLKINYDSLTNNFNFKPDSVGQNETIGTWMSGLIDNTQLINKKEFMTDIMNRFYGTASSAQNKTADEIAEELKLEKLIEQLSNNDESFEISPEDYKYILDQANNLSNGIATYDLGCGELDMKLELSGLTKLINNTFGSTNPLYIGNEIGNTINESTTDSTISDENSDTIRDNFFHKIIEFIKKTLLKAITSTPQVRMIMAIYSSFKNNGETKIKTAKEDLKEFKTMIKCLIKSVLEMINKYIYEFIVSILIVLLKPVVKKIVKEKSNQYIDTMLNLIYG